MAISHCVGYGCNGTLRPLGGFFSTVGEVTVGF